MLNMKIFLLPTEFCTAWPKSIWFQMQKLWSFSLKLLFCSLIGTSAEKQEKRTKRKPELLIPNKMETRSSCGFMLDKLRKPWRIENMDFTICERAAWRTLAVCFSRGWSCCFLLEKPTRIPELMLWIATWVHPSMKQCLTIFYETLFSLLIYLETHWDQNLTKDGQTRQTEITTNINLQLFGQKLQCFHKPDHLRVSEAAMRRTTGLSFRTYSHSNVYFPSRPKYQPVFWYSSSFSMLMTFSYEYLKLSLIKCLSFSVTTTCSKPVDWSNATCRRVKLSCPTKPQEPELWGTGLQVWKYAESPHELLVSCQIHFKCQYWPFSNVGRSVQALNGGGSGISFHRHRSCMAKITFSQTDCNEFLL